MYSLRLFAHLPICIAFVNPSRKRGKILSPAKPDPNIHRGAYFTLIDTVRQADDGFHGAFPSLAKPVNLSFYLTFWLVSGVDAIYKEVPNDLFK